MNEAIQTHGPKTSASTHAWFNGHLCPREDCAPSIASINLHLGTSVFDGLMAYWNRDHYYLHRAEEHLHRFIKGAARMSLGFSWTAEQMVDGIHLLLKAEPQCTQYIRPIAFRRAPELWVTGSLGKPVDVAIFTVKATRDIRDAMTAHISPIERISSRAIPQHTKVSGAYVNSFYARRTAEASGFQDGIMLDREGRITEASAANFFAICNGRLETPPLDPDVFPGITREVVLEIARHLDIEYAEVDLRATDVAAFDGAFLCSTLMEIKPLSCIGTHALRTTESELFNAILDQFRSITHQ